MKPWHVYYNLCMGYSTDSKHNTYVLTQPYHMRGQTNGQRRKLNLIGDNHNIECFFFQMNQIFLVYAPSFQYIQMPLQSLQTGQYSRFMSNK